MNPVYRQASFTGSADKLDGLPTGVVREVAFAGRSNAGKSSAINTLTGNSKLARTSRTPGRTQLINHFLLQPGYYLVDLPGYGYAKVSKKQRSHWRRLLSGYLIDRSELSLLVILMDIRHPLTDNDWQLIEMQQHGQSELHVVLTKCDKLSKNKAARALQETQHELGEAGLAVTLQTFSSVTQEGVGDLAGVLDEHLFGVAT